MVQFSREDDPVQFNMCKSHTFFSVMFGKSPRKGGGIWWGQVSRSRTCRTDKLPWIEALLIHAYMAQVQSTGQSYWNDVEGAEKYDKDFANKVTKHPEKYNAITH
jgi:hypothetical protein